MLRPPGRLLNSLLPHCPPALAAHLYTSTPDPAPSPAHGKSHPPSPPPTRDLPASSSGTPPILPWCARLTSRRFARLIRRQNDPSLALLAFQHHDRSVPGFRHNYLTYGAIIKLLAHAHAFDDLEHVLTQLAHSDPPVRCDEDPFIAVIRAYGLAGRPVDAMRMFLTVRSRFGIDPSIRSFNELLNAMIRNRRADLAVRLFKDSQRRFGIRPNMCSCNIVVKPLCKVGDFGGATMMLEEMPTWGMVPNVVTYTTVLAAFCSRGDICAAQELFSEMLDRGLSPDETTYTVLIDGFCRLGSLIDAAKLMDDMEANEVAPNEITYSIMIESCCKAGKAGEAMNLLVDMLAAEHIPTPTMCCRVIDALCVDGKVEEACLTWRKMVEKNCMHDDSILPTLVHWLSKEGKVHQATKLFMEFNTAFSPNAMTYNTLISGLCDIREIQEASRLWGHMLEKRCSPNGFTYNALVAGFCKAGMMVDGVHLFEEMVKKGFIPSKATYEAMADGFHVAGVENGLYDTLAALATAGEAAFVDGNCWEVLLQEAAVGEEIRNENI